MAEHWINFLAMAVHDAWMFGVHQMSLSHNYSDMKVILMMIFRSFVSRLLANVSNEMTRSGHVYSTDPVNVSSHWLINGVKKMHVYLE